VWVALNTAECVAGHWLIGLVLTMLFMGIIITGEVLMFSMDGLSLTHGAPGSRQHIWTFASGFFTGNENSPLLDFRWLKY